MDRDQNLSPQEMKERRRYERYELYLPVHFRILSDSGVPFTKEPAEGFSRNYSKEGLLVEFSSQELDKSADDLVNAVVRGSVMLPVSDSPIVFEGEIKWVRRFGASRYFIGVFISYIDDVHRVQLLQFARKINRRSKLIVSLVFTLILTIAFSIMLVFSFNAYINKITARQQQIYKELNDRIQFLTGKLNEIAAGMNRRNN
jgi:hypothetical protein